MNNHAPNFVVFAKSRNPRNGQLKICGPKTGYVSLQFNFFTDLCKENEIHYLVHYRTAYSEWFKKNLWNLVTEESLTYI